MQLLGRQYSAPLEDEAKKFSSSQELGAVRSAGRALLGRKAALIPGDRRESLLQVGRGPGVGRCGGAGVAGVEGGGRAGKLCSTVQLSGPLCCV
jgi:hypothetical protein